MRIDEIEKISEYFDQQIDSSSELINIFPVETEAAKFFSNLQIISKSLVQDTERFLQDYSNIIDDNWTKINNKINLEEERLNTALSSAFALPPEYEDIDIWSGLQSKIDANDTKEEHINQNKIMYSELELDWEILIDKTFELPISLQSLDIWEGINKKLDSLYHKEMFSASLSEQTDEKEKFFTGFSEFIDMEISAKKAQQMNEHLSQCGSCRNYYLNFIRLRSILKESFTLPELIYQSEDSFWAEIANTLFPEEQENHVNKKKLI